MKKLRHYKHPRVSAEYIDCPLCLTFDQYSLCSHKCLYCFSTALRSTNPSFSHELRQIDHKKIAKLFRRDTSELKSKWERALYECFFKRKQVLHWGGLNDPFCGIERRRKIGLKVIKAAIKTNYPVSFCTKGNVAKLKDHMEVFSDASSQANFMFHFTITVNDDKMAREIEPGAPSPTERLRSIEKLSNMGYVVGLRFRPFIPGISERGFEKLLNRARDAGIKSINFGFYNLYSASTEDPTLGKFSKKMSKYSPVDVCEYFNKLSIEKGVICKTLNRNMKEFYFRKVYDFCIKNKIIFACKDNDFRELNHSECCCGLPDKKLAKYLGIKVNKGFFNWQPYQVGSLIIRLRKAFWEAGGKKEIRVTLDEAIPRNDYTKFMQMSLFGKTSLSTIGMGTLNERVFTLRDEFTKKWNSTTPYYFYSGKMEPCDVDLEGNLIYRYVPSDYEFRWIEDGIDLAKFPLSTLGKLGE